MRRRKFTLTESAKPVEKNNDYTGESFIVGVRYGTEGISPCFRNSKCRSCVMSSGASYCGNYGGHEEVNVENKILYIVRCLGEVYCEI